MHPSASAGVRLSAIVALAALVIFIVCPLGSISSRPSPATRMNPCLCSMHWMRRLLQRRRNGRQFDRACRLGRCTHNGDGHSSGPASFPHILGAKPLARYRAFDPLHDAALHRCDGLDSFHAKARTARTASAARRRSYAGIFQLGRARFRNESPRASLHDDDHEECADPCARQS